MTTAPLPPLNPAETISSRTSRPIFVVAVLLALAIGCSRPAEITTYSIPTRIPDQLRLGQERMLAAMIPKGKNVWFFKVSGPEPAIQEMDDAFRQFVEQIEFSGDAPDLSRLPQGWRMGSNVNKEFRFASIDVDTPSKQLDLSVSQLARQGDWGEQVKMNVNRWRGQLKLPPSDQPWAGGEPFEVAAADSPGIWVDLLGESDTSAVAKSPPFAKPPSGGPPSGGRSPSARAVAEGASPAASDSKASAENATASPLRYDQPEAWRAGRMTSMRLASFLVGPEDSPAELTIIPAGGDLRGNVARWLGQVRGGDAPDEVVDQALADAQTLEVDGRQAQRFFLTGEDASQGEAIDATIIPLEGGVSLFVKMTGPARIVSEQAEAIASFLKSLELNL